MTTEDETTQSDDAPMTSAEDFEDKVDAMELLGVPQILGSPKSLEDEAVLGNPESLSGEVGYDEHEDVFQPPLDTASAPPITSTPRTLDETLLPEAVSSSEHALDEDILTSLDLMEHDDSGMESELELDDALDGADDMELAEAAMLDDAPSFGGGSDLVALVREQQQQLIAAERRVSELETQLSARLSIEEERALRDEVASYKTLVDGNGKAKKAKKDKKSKKEKPEKNKADKTNALTVS